MPPDKNWSAAERFPKDAEAYGFIVFNIPYDEVPDIASRMRQLEAAADSLSISDISLDKLSMNSIFMRVTEDAAEKEEEEEAEVEGENVPASNSSAAVEPVKDNDA